MIIRSITISLVCEFELINIKSGLHDKVQFCTVQSLIDLLQNLSYNLVKHFTKLLNLHIPHPAIDFTIHPSSIVYCSIHPSIETISQTLIQPLT
jgi:hypothetical protein